MNRKVIVCCHCCTVIDYARGYQIRGIKILRQACFHQIKRTVSHFYRLIDSVACIAKIQVILIVVPNHLQIKWYIKSISKSVNQI